MCCSDYGKELGIRCWGCAAPSVHTPRCFRITVRALIYTNDNVWEQLEHYMPEENTDDGAITCAEFSGNTVVYLWIMTNIILLCSIVGIVVMIFWIPFGWIIHKKQLQNATCNLTKRSIAIRKGWIFKAQQNIPLDKLTDISIHEGPVLNLFGIVRISIETAGATPFHLIGLDKSTTPQFRDIVMKQRDTQTGTQDTSAQGGQSNDVLVEIRDILQQINANLSKRE